MSFRPDHDLEASAYDSHHADAVHARPIYMGSGHSEFPCGLDARTPAMVAAWDDEVTCPKCLADVRLRAKHGIPKPDFDAAKAFDDAMAAHAKGGSR